MIISFVVVGIHVCETKSAEKVIISGYNDKGDILNPFEIKEEKSSIEGCYVNDIRYYLEATKDNQHIYFSRPSELMQNLIPNLVYHGFTVKQIRISPERSAHQEWKPTRYEIELISRYEKEFAIPADQRVTEWIGDLALYEVKSDVTETIFTKRLEHILEQTDLTLEEINSGLLSDSDIQTAVERSLLASSPAEESIVAQYTDHGVLNVIKQYPSGKFYNHYGYDPKTKVSNSRAGAYHSLAEAKEMMERHRSKAVEQPQDDKKADKETDTVSIRFAKKQIYGEHTITVKGQEITYVNVALPKTSKYHGYALSINRDRIRDDKFNPKMAFASISDKEYTLSKWDKAAQKAQEISLTAQQIKKEFDSWKQKKRDTPVR